MVRLPKAHKKCFILFLFILWSIGLCGVLEAACTYSVINGVRVMENQVCTETVTIDGSAWSGGIIRNNVFKNQSSFGLAVKNLNNLTIENNEFYGMQNNGISVRETQTVGTDNVIIQNNYFHDMPNSGIYVGEPNTNTKILNNVFRNVGSNAQASVRQHGLYVKGPGFLVEGNTIDGVASANGISVRTAGIVRSNYVTNVADAGIKYFSDSNDIGNGLLIIENNVVVNNEGNGVGLIYSADYGTPINSIVVRFNTCVNNTLGVWIEGFSQMHLEVYGNIIVESNGNYTSFDITPAVNTMNLKSTSDIGFVYFQQNDFHLTATSQAINYASSVPGIPPYDYDKNSMGLNPYDAGAFQYHSDN